MSNYAIKIRELGKEYRIGKYQEPYTTFRDAIVRTAQAPFKRMGQILRGEAYGASNLTESIWALKDISFDVKHGEVVGIIGHNGAGKSTLLKILSQITEPSVGEVRLYGRVGALLEVGTGFHEELTGRENIFLNGAILGMGRTEINNKFDEIVDFSGVEKFIDTPVKHYSSGMKLRLGFAVAAHLEPEILVVDEVLAVGDAEFQKKCLNKMENVAASGRTVLFVSHNMAAVENLCSRAIILEHGQVTGDGQTDDMIVEYLARNIENISVSLDERVDREGDGQVRFSNLQFWNPKTNSEVIRSGDPLEIRLDFVGLSSQLQQMDMSAIFVNFSGQRVFTCGTRFKSAINTIGGGQQLVFKINRLPLPEGNYTLDLWCGSGGYRHDAISNAATFYVSNADFYGSGKQMLAGKHGVILVDFDWELRLTETSQVVN